MIRKTTILTLFVFFTAISFAQTANFTTTTTSGCSPLVVNFQDLSTGNPATWFWDFGNGATSTLRNPSTTFFNPGTYTVTLTVTNSQGSNTLTRTNYITVYGKPDIGFTVNDSTACFPHRAQFTDLSIASPGTTNTSWLWDFGDGTQSTAQNPLHVYTSAGNYTVTVKVTNNRGCFAVFTKPAYIRIAGGVASAFTNTTPTVCKPPFNISFTNSSTGPGTLTWFWDFGDGNTSTEQNPVHTYNAAGDYTVLLATTSSDGCSDTLRKTNAVPIQPVTTSFAAPDSICIDALASFQNTSTPSPSASNWVFSDGNTGSTPNISRTFSTPGIYSVTLYNTYSFCQDSVKKNIKVLPRPVAAFDADIRVKCQPNLTVNFQNQSQNGVSWLWNFGDGNTSTAQNPSHTYTSYGSFAVTLITTNSSGCTDTLVAPDYIRIARPVISFPGLPARGCIPYTINLAADIVTLDLTTSYLWNFGDGNTSSAPNPTHTYTSQGTYTVTLTITTSSGCTETFTLSDAVKVGRRPVIDFTGQPTIACAFQSVQFTDLTNEADEWQWLFGDGSSSTEQNPTHQYSDTGFQSVTLYATNNGCRDSLTKIDYIRIKPPIADFGYLTSCDNRLLFDFRDSSIGATTWFWDFGDGNTSTLQNPVHIYSAYDTYTVSLTVTNDTCSHTYAREIKVINESPDIGVSTTVACNPTSFAFNAIVADPSSISEYRWIFGDGNEAVLTQQQASHQYANSGFYTVRLITTDIYGCQDTVTKPNFIRVNGPVANFSSQNNRGCKGLTVVFDDLSQDDGLADIVSWKWDFGDGNVQTLTSGPFQHTYPDAGDYSVQLTVTDANGCSSDKFIPFFVNTSDPNADFRAVDTLQCPGSTTLFVNSATGNFLNHYWDFGDGQLGYTATPSHVYENNGLYTVKLVIVDNFGCRDSLVRTDYISVSSPAASFSMNDSISSCTPFEVQFTNTSQYYLTSTWDLGGGTSTMQDPVQFYNTPGVYPIRLIVTSPGGCKDTATGQVQVYDTAGSRITYLPLDGCKPLGVDLTATPTGPVDTYTWDFGDGVLVTNTSTVISHVYNSFGNFVPKVILTDPSGCIIPVTGIDTVRIKGATVKFGADKLLLCDSGFISFTDSTLYNDSLSVYNWDFGDGTTSNLENPVHYYTSPGNYSVTLNVLTESACVDTFRLAAPVRVIESPLVSIGGDSVICVNEFINHLGVFERTDTSVVRWSWRFPNGNSAAVQNPVRQQYTTAGNFEVEAIAINSSGCRDTAYKSLLINPLPTVDLPGSLTMQAGFPVQLPATYTSNVISWSWTPGATLNCTECPQPIAAPKFNTRYNVAFADSNGCRNTGQIEVLVICKNANVFVPNTFSPNGDGSNDVFYVRGKGLDRVKSIRVFNRWGEVVFERVNFPVNDAAYGWDGKYKGNKPVADVYVYQVEVFCDNSQIIRFEGNIALIQ